MEVHFLEGSRRSSATSQVGGEGEVVGSWIDVRYSSLELSRRTEAIPGYPDRDNKGPATIEELSV